MKSELKTQTDHISLTQVALKATFVIVASVLILFRGQSFGQSKQAVSSARGQFVGLPLAAKAGASNQEIVNRYGVPFVKGNLEYSPEGLARIDVGCSAKKVYLLGMTESGSVRCWRDPRDYSVRFFVGDTLGKITLQYADNSIQVFPLILGEGIWWGVPFFRFQEPFPTDPRLRKALAASLRLCPLAPVEDGDYVAVIIPGSIPIQTIILEKSPAKQGTPTVTGITIESTGKPTIVEATLLTPGRFPPEFVGFIREKSLLPTGAKEQQTRRRLDDLRRSLYTSDLDFKGHVPLESPAGYSGPKVNFKGDLFARILTNAFSWNVQDMIDKLDSNGTYHTSTKGATSWNGNGFGTFRTNVGLYYRDSWSRDMGRSLQELVDLGFLTEASRCADYCLSMARLWGDKGAPTMNGEFYHAHWSRVANRLSAGPPFENDGHGLITMFLYKLWQRLPDRDEWLRGRWTDVKAAGDWILWQFENPTISGAVDGVLHTTGECAEGNGYSVYADAVCRDALRALAQMADSVGDLQSAE